MEQATEVAKTVIRPEAIAAAAGGVGVALGFVGGFFAARRKLETKYRELAEAEVAEMRGHFQAKELARRNKDQAEAIVQRAGYRSESDEPVATGSLEVEAGSTEAENNGHTTVNVFTPPEWDYATETAHRALLAPETPYIIHAEEFEAAELDLSQMSITYYAGDDVLADATDERIDNHDLVVGLENLSRFGYGSGDRNVLYVRNVSLGVEYEIAYSAGSFAAEVLGETEG